MGDLTTTWGVRWVPAPNARIRLFCVPHAGGGAAAYRTWARELAPDIEVVAIRLPGRESRIREQPQHCMNELVPALVHGISPLLDRPHAWFGHSMGALVAFEACRALRRLRFPEPDRLLVSGHPAPHLPWGRPIMHNAPTEDLVTRLQQLSDTPREVLADESVLAALLPMLRADFSLFETYRHTDEPPLRQPISVFCGEDDDFATEQELAAWHQHSSAESTFHLLSGDHFFLHKNHREFLHTLRIDLHGGVLNGQSD